MRVRLAVLEALTGNLTPHDPAEGETESMISDLRGEVARLRERATDRACLAQHTRRGEGACLNRVNRTTGSGAEGGPTS